MNFVQILTPTKNKLFLSAILFSAAFLLSLFINSINIRLPWESIIPVRSFGLPLAFYTLICEIPASPPNYPLIDPSPICKFEFNIWTLLVDVLFWYGIAAVIKRNEYAS